MFKSKTQKLFSALMAGLITTASFNFGAIQVFAQGNRAESYEIYPIPHDISYNDGEFDFSGNINVVYGEGIDDETKARLREVADLKDEETLLESNTVSDGKNILVGINGKNDAVNAEFQKAGITVDTSGLFETKLDSYVLSITNDTIIVLGKDTDSAFYGLTTLYHIVKQLPDNTITNLEVEDYADVASRGFIEGYYGNPWSTEDRISLMEWGGYYKLNSYFYAPKDDAKHNRAWRQLYTDEEIETKIKPLAEAGNNSKCRFVYALHPYMNSPIRHGNEEHYQEDIKIMQTKFEQVIKAGVRQIAILADDAASVGGENYIRMLQDMTEWLNTMQQTYPDLKLTLPFCTVEYGGVGENYYRNFPENVQIVMTGGKVWGEVSQRFTDTFTNNVGRGPYLWINWPCTDNSKKHLIMGGFKDFLHPNVSPNNIEGIVLNPMQQSEPSKVAIFGNACYSWNIWDSEEQADIAWENSFKYVDHNSAIPTDASNSLRELSKHMINQAMDNRVIALQESVELKEKLTPFKEALQTGAIDKSMIGQIDDLINEFNILENARKTYNSGAGDQRLKSQMVYWLNCWKDTNASAINYLNAIKAYISGEESNTVFDLYSKGKNSFEKSKTYGFHYVDHTEYAQVGVQHIVPFIKAMESYLSDIVSAFVNPEKQVIKPITNRNDNPSSSINNMIDGDDSTFAQWKSPNYSEVGEYMGISYLNPIDVNEVKFLLSNSAQGKVNGFSQSKLEYTKDGITWIEIPGTQQDNPVHQITATGLTLTDVKGLRVICTQRSDDIWPAVREIYVNGKPVNYDPNKYDHRVIRTQGYQPSQNTNESALTDGDDNTFVWYSTPGNVANEGDYIGIDLGKVMKIDNVKFIMGASGNDHWDEYDLEYSINGNNYETFKSYTQSTDKKLVTEKFNGIEARYIRIKNTKYKQVWLKMSEFKVTPITDYVDTNNQDLSDLSVNKGFDIMSIASKNGITLQPTQYIGLDLNRIRDITNLDVETVNGDNLTLESSQNHDTWSRINVGQQNRLHSRYVRLVNNTDQPITFNLNKFEVSSLEIQKPYLHSSNVGINTSWGDTRENGAAFDGNINSQTKFAGLPESGQYIIYDLGQEREINKIQLYCNDNQTDYIRDADIKISNSLDGEWTKVVTIGDGIENVNDTDIICKDAKNANDTTVYTTSSTYPNKVYVEGTVQPTTARYLKIEFTASNRNRAILFNEIIINGGEYVPVINDPSFESNSIEVAGMSPQNMVDSNLDTAYRPNTEDSGYIKYILSEKLNVSKVNIVQNGEESNATVTFLVQKNGKEPEEIKVGKLVKSLNQFFVPFWDKLLEVRIDWDAGKTPTISEMIFINDVKYGADHSELTATIEACTVEETDYISSSYKEFKEIYDEVVLVNENSQSTPEELKQAKEKLEIAFSSLIKRGDISLIQSELDKISKLDKNNYTTASWKALEEVVAQAKELLESSEQVTEEQVNDMVLKLQQSILGLVLTENVSKQDLQNLIDSFKDIDSSLFITDTFNRFKEALDNALNLINKEDATQKEISNAYKNLQDTYNKLVLKATEQQVNELKLLIDSFKEESYTANSWNEFAKVIDEINKSLEKEIASSDISLLREKIITLSQKLVIRGDTSRVEELLHIIESLDPSKYTKDSYKKLMDVVSEVKKSLNNRVNLSQKDVDELVKKLENSYKSLRPVNIDNNNTNNNANNNSHIANTRDTALSTIPVLLILLSLIGISSFLLKMKLSRK